MEKHLDADLKKFSLTLLPLDAHVEKKREIADKLFELLRKKTRYVDSNQIGWMRKQGYVDRCYIAGSAGKKTEVEVTSDLDLVIFVNDIEPPFNKVLQDFSKIIRRNGLKDHQLGYLILRPSLNAIELKIDNFEIHIFPAPNYMNHCHQKPKLKILAAQQAVRTFKEIQSHPHLAQILNSGLCETQLEFIREQNSIIHELTRLCKYWDQKTPVTGHIKDRATLIELIEINVGKNTFKESGYHLVMFNGFNNFLKLMENFENMEIEFDFDPLNIIGGGRGTGRSWQVGLKSPPFVIDLANPFRNLASGVSIGQMEQYKMAAMEHGNHFSASSQ